MTEAEAILIAEQVRSKIEASEPTGVPVTASIGLATWTSGMRSRAQIIAQADKALYRAKADGRNRVVVASTMWADEAGSYAA